MSATTIRSDDGRPGAGGPAPRDGGHLQYLLTAYLFENISEAGKHEVESHLQVCADCRSELGELRETLRRVQEALLPAKEGESYSFEARRLERVLSTGRELRGGQWFRGRRLSFSLAAAAAAAVLYVAFFRIETLTFGRKSPASASLETAPAELRLAGAYRATGGSDEEGLSIEDVAVAPGGGAGARSPGSNNAAPHLDDRPAEKPPAGASPASPAPAAEVSPPAAQAAGAAVEVAAAAPPGGPPARISKRLRGGAEESRRTQEGDRDGVTGNRGDARFGTFYKSPEDEATDLARDGEKTGTPGGHIALEQRTATKAREKERFGDQAGDRKEPAKARVEFYDLGGIVRGPDYPAPPLALQELNAGAPAGEKKAEHALEIEKVLELVGNELKNDPGGQVPGEARVQNGKLMLKTTPENQEKVKRLLDQLQKASGVTVTSESRFLETQENFLEEIGVDLGTRNNADFAFYFGSSSPSTLETSGRAYSYWRRVDPRLTPQQFKVRLLEVPPPQVGDEGLGEEGFRKRYGVNPFVDTSRDHLSTFGMDVDTASYTLARSLLRSGKLPEPKQMRVEEFVNYFREEVAADPEAVFSVSSEGGPAPFGEGLDLLKITVKARELRPNEEKPAVLTFAVDTSGSMNLQNRLELVRGALKTLAASLKPEDRVGIVAYDAHAYLVLPHTQARERARISGAIDSLAPGGGTNVEAGLELAYRIADEVFERRAVNRVILCSDGVANVGARGPEEILKKVQVFAARGIYLSSVGFGMGRYNDAMLETLANRGNGNYAYVDSLAAAEEIFRKNLPSTLQVLAKDAKVQVDWNPEVVSHYRLLGYENRDVADRDFRNDQVDAGEVGPGTTVTVLYEIRRHSQAAGDLGRIYLRYLDTGTGRVEEVNYPLSPGVLATSQKDTSDRFRFMSCAAETAELLRGSHWARNGSFGKVLEVLSGLSPDYRARPDCQELTELATRAQELVLKALAGK